MHKNRESIDKQQEAQVIKIELEGEITFTATTVEDKRKLIELRKLISEAKKPDYTTIKINSGVTSEGDLKMNIRGIEND
jgi:hypothetical protein